MKIPAQIPATSLMLLAGTVGGAEIRLPPRPSDAKTGAELVEFLEPMDREERESAILHEFISGNVPTFLRTLVPVSAEDGSHRIVYCVTPEYVALGSDDDFFRMPMSPTLAQRIADSVGCTLPTRKMVDDIWRAAEVKLEPRPIPPSPAMTTIPVFWDHNVMIREQRRPTLPEHPLGRLVGGHKKDVVLTPQLASHPGKVAIYGWHHLDGTPIQNLYLGHADFYADYSHGIRLVAHEALVDGRPDTIGRVLVDPVLAPLISDEGTYENARYPLPPEPADGNPVVSGGFEEEFAGGTAPGWTAWIRAGNPYFGRASINRHAGDHSQYWGRTGSAGFDGGVLQQVSVEEGRRYVVTAWLKRQCSIDGVFLRFGWDPDGGTDPENGGVTWLDLTARGDETWIQVRTAVTAASPALTLFARGGHPGSPESVSAFFYLDTVRLTPADPSSVSLY